MDKRSIIFVILLTISLFTVNYFFKPEPPKTPIAVENSARASLAPIAANTALAAKTSPPEEAVLENLPGGEEFYVLENEYQQIVFSNIGGAIAEINLRFDHPFIETDHFIIYFLQQWNFSVNANIFPPRINIIITRRFMQL